jgi:Flp pilus assembly pilin Flp
VTRAGWVGRIRRGWNVTSERLIWALTSAAGWWRERVARLREPAGATAVEYAIMLAFIAAIIVAGVALLGQGTKAGFEKVRFP